LIEFALPFFFHNFSTFFLVPFSVLA
jgi:hypothetical protein